MGPLEIDQIKRPLGLLALLAGGRKSKEERTFEYFLNSNMRVRAINLREKYNQGGWFVANFKDPCLLLDSIVCSVLVWGREVQPCQLDNWQNIEIPSK